MRNLKFLSIMLITVSTLTFSQTTWTVDKSHSKVGFSVSHLVITDVDGFFKDYDAQISSNGDDFSTANIELKVNTSSIFTDNEKRDDHLRSDDFFNSGKYPQMTFKGKSMKKVGDKKYKLTGDFTIRDVTKQITPAAYFAAGKWLQGFAYHVRPGIAPALLAAAFTLLIAFLAVAYKAVQAARANPTESLRYE